MILRLCKAAVIIGSALSLSAAAVFDEPLSVCGKVGPAVLSNLNLDRKGPAVAVHPGEKIFATVNITWDESELNPHTPRQIVVGIEGMGAQRCIVNEFGYRLGKGIHSFYLQAPSEPGVYTVQFNLEEAASPLQAMKLWEENNSLQTVLGKIVVSEP